MRSAAELRAYHRTVSLVRTMFIHTADQNYIGARSAFCEHRDFDFWWLTLHTVEKYLKAIILLKGKTANQANHNIKTLLKRVKSIDPRLTPPPFIRPRIAGAASEFEEGGSFIDRLNMYGSPANRYASYSYTIGGSDIFAADNLIYWARRHARILKQEASDGIRIDWIEELANNPRLWLHHDGSPLEKLAQGPLDSAAARPFVRGNVAFFPQRRHRPLQRHGVYIRNGPFFNMLSTLRNSPAGSEERVEMRAALQWAIEHIFIPDQDLKYVRAVLNAHP